MYATITLSASFPCTPTTCDSKKANESVYHCVPVNCSTADWDYVNCECIDLTDGDFDDHNPSPILLSVGNGPVYELTGPKDGVYFDINADGKPERVGWTLPSEPTGFLVLDRNHNGLIDNGRELFGNFTPVEGDELADTGFQALAFWDDPSALGNGNGWIDPGDAVWPSLQLWIDANHDGVSQPDELYPPAAFGISAISTFSHTERRRDRFGNLFYLRGEFIIQGKNRIAYDVFLSQPIVTASSAAALKERRKALAAERGLRNRGKLIGSRNLFSLGR